MLLALPIVVYLCWVFDIGPEDEVHRIASNKPWLEASITAIALVGLGVGCWMVLTTSDSVAPRRPYSDHRMGLRWNRFIQVRLERING
jgi:hypothetical protein